MENYIVLDIESPNGFFNSISAIGIYIIKNKEIVDKIYSLINPEDEFEDFTIDMTGITPEMVKDKPTFKEFWPNIEELLVVNTIIGHNITYDLEVISNSLKNYNIPVPEFKYMCTLILSQQRLDLKSYKLTDIMHYLDIKYDAHNALEDARVTHILFNYLNDIKPVSIVNQKVFSPKSSKEKIAEELYPNINELYGMILEFKNKKEITQNQIELLKQWIEKNMEYCNYPKIKNIILRLNIILGKDKLNEDDRINIVSFITGIHKSDKYSYEELNYQILKGILKMYECDEVVTVDEKKFLKKWISYYDLPQNLDKKEIIDRYTK